MTMPTITETYGLIGHPLGHSFSQKYFTDKFLREGIDAEYLNFDIEDITDLKFVLQDNLYLAGFNVTIPYKREIIPFLDHIDPLAKEIGAVNTVKVSQKVGKTVLTGFNTDILGFMESIRPHLKTYHTNALILGTGGASKAVAAALKKLGINYTFVSRNPAPGQLGYDTLTEDVMSRNKVIVNCTPLGTFPANDTFPALPYRFITDRHLCFDLVYNPPLTKFLEKSAEQGAEIVNGAEMLRIQADEAWKIWRNDMKKQP